MLRDVSAFLPNLIADVAAREGSGANWILKKDGKTPAKRPWLMRRSTVTAARSGPGSKTAALPKRRRVESQRALGCLRLRANAPAKNNCYTEANGPGGRYGPAQTPGLSSGRRPSWKAKSRPAPLSPPVIPWGGKTLFQNAKQGLDSAISQSNPDATNALCAHWLDGSIFDLIREGMKKCSSGPGTGTECGAFHLDKPIYER